MHDQDIVGPPVRDPQNAIGKALGKPGRRHRAVLEGGQEQTHVAIEAGAGRTHKLLPGVVSRVSGRSVPGRTSATYDKWSTSAARLKLRGSHPARKIGRRGQSMRGVAVARGLAK